MWGTPPLLDEARKSSAPACCTSALLPGGGLGGTAAGGGGGVSATLKAPVGASLFFCPSKVAIGNLFFFFFLRHRVRAPPAQYVSESESLSSSSL